MHPCAEHTTVFAMPFLVANSRYSASSNSLASAAPDIGLLLVVLPARFRALVGVKCGVKSTADSQKPSTQAPRPSHKPDSALSRHPSPGDSRASLEGSCAYQQDARRPGNLACSHRWFTWPVPPAFALGCRRWALTPPFHPSPVIGSDATRSIGWSALCCT
jgi:hypothetical protein